MNDNNPIIKESNSAIIFFVVYTPLYYVTQTKKFTFYQY